MNSVDALAEAGDLDGLVNLLGTEPAPLQSSNGTWLAVESASKRGHAKVVHFLVHTHGYTYRQRAIDWARALDRKEVLAVLEKDAGAHLVIDPEHELFEARHRAEMQEQIRIAKLKGGVGKKDKLLKAAGSTPSVVSACKTSAQNTLQTL